MFPPALVFPGMQITPLESSLSVGSGPYPDFGQLKIVFCWKRFKSLIDRRRASVSDEEGLMMLSRSLWIDIISRKDLIN